MQKHNLMLSTNSHDFYAYYWFANMNPLAPEWFHVFKHPIHLNGRSSKLVQNQLWVLSREVAVDSGRYLWPYTPLIISAFDQEPS